MSIYYPSISLLGIYSPLQIENHVYKITVHECPLQHYPKKLKNGTTQMMNEKTNVINLYNGLLFNHKKE